MPADPIRTTWLTPIRRGPLYVLLVISLILIFGGGFMAWFFQTEAGTIDVRDVRFMGSNQLEMSGLLYIPKGVSADNPAPGILAVHGYINSRETQDGFAIEFARRGFVVLAIDQTGHGFSDPPAFANGFGGPDGLAYLRSLDFVDKDNIGLEGHSMGGWAILIAADAFPDGYQSMVLEGSSTGTLGAPDGTPTFPRNLAVVYSLYDDFSQLMWGVDVARDVVNTEKMQTLFGTNQTIERGKVYGSIANGTARVLYQPPVVHPGDHISPLAIGYAISWFQQTLKGAKPLPVFNQVWYWKEFGNFIALIGAVLFLFPAGGLLLTTSTFSSLRDPIPEAKPARGIFWWLSALLLIAIPIVTYFWFQNLGAKWLPPNWFWPEEITTGIMVWAVGNGLIALILFLIWHYTRNRVTGADSVNYGWSWPTGLHWGKIFKSFVLAAIVIFLAYLLLAISFWLYTIDFRIWVVALKVMDPLRFRLFLDYLIPFIFFFLILGTILHGELRLRRDGNAPVSMALSMLVNLLLLVLGFLILLAVQYIPVFAGGSLTFGEPLLTIVAYQFVPLMIIVSLVSTYFFRKTGHIYVGAFINAMFVSWYIVASQAIQFAV